MRTGLVYRDDHYAGTIKETDGGDFEFRYDPTYLQNPSSEPVSLTLPLQVEPYRSRTLFAFFDGLIPEGWLLDLSVRNWKLRPQDRMGLLLSACQECIGNVSIRAENNANT